ncbi:MAG: 6-phosphogluconolactonase [bacterium]|nr:6-phosphogluconolactonase [bacterium]
MSVPAPEIRILPSAEAAVPLLLDELRRTVTRFERPLVSFATGGTFTAMLRALVREFTVGKPGTIFGREFSATHLDEYAGFDPTRDGGMVHELTTACPPLSAMLAAERFLPVPHVEDAAAIGRHAERLRAAGGVKLQFLGIGRNGHIAFNEPGTDLDGGFHATDLAEATRRDARARFAPAEPPRRAITSGVGTILGAERLVLCAFGSAKAPAIEAMLRGDVSPACPASAVRRHADVLVLLDAAAAAGITDESVAP